MADHRGRNREQFDVLRAAELIFDEDFEREIAVQDGSDDDADFDHYSDEEDRDETLEREIFDDAPPDTGDENGERDRVAAYDAETEVESDSDEETDYNNNWVKTLRNFPRIPDFTAQTGIQVDLGEDPSPYDVYKVFFSNDLLKLIKTETNRYADSEIQKKKQESEEAGTPLSKRSLYLTWKAVTLPELRDFFAICIHMGLVKKPRITDYWSKHPALHTSYAANLLPRDRFIAIMMFLHLNDNTKYVPRNQEGHDPIHKIRPVMKHLQEKFSEVYYPEKSVCVDEAMCPFKGRSRFKVYMKDKPTKWGFKFYELCESATGYVFRFEMFCAQPGVSNKPYDVVRRLMGPLEQKGHHLYIDNYYCEPKICQDLATLDTMVTGTVRKNRVHMPKDLAQGALQRGSLDYRRRGNVIACRWMDKKDVYVLSTMHKPVLQETQGRYEQKQKPLAVIDYITNMAGVDQSDQLVSYFPMHRKSCKWWKKPFFHMLTLVMIQTMIILNKHRKSRGRKRMALEDVVKAVCSKMPVTPVEEPESAADGPARVLRRVMPKGTHFPEEIPHPEGKTNKVFRNCKVCYEKSRRAGVSAKELSSRRKQTSTWCPDCRVNLCLPCFKAFHTRENYLD